MSLHMFSGSIMRNAKVSGILPAAGICGDFWMYAEKPVCRCGCVSAPWAHGECRNGGFPDWLVKECADRLRSNDRYICRRSGGSIRK